MRLSLGTKHPRTQARKNDEYKADDYAPSVYQETNASATDVHARTSDQVEALGELVPVRHRYLFVR